LVQNKENSLFFFMYIYISKLSLPFGLAQEGKTGNRILSISLLWFSLVERRKGRILSITLTWPDLVCGSVVYFTRYPTDIWR
jgi:hypothetical protein